MANTMDQVAGQVREALATENLSAFSELLDPEVTWGHRVLAILVVRIAIKCWLGISVVAKLESEGARSTLKSSVIDSSSV